MDIDRLLNRSNDFWHYTLDRPRCARQRHSLTNDSLIPCDLYIHYLSAPGRPRCALLPSAGHWQRGDGRTYSSSNILAQIYHHRSECSLQVRGPVPHSDIMPAYDNNLVQVSVTNDPVTWVHPISGSSTTGEAPEWSG